MKLPVINRFQKQNYPGSPDWFTRFIADLNQFSETVWNTLNNNISIQDNLDSQIYTFTLTAGALETDNTISFNTTLKHVPQVVGIGYITNTASYSAPVTGTSLSWIYSAPQIQINAISGLTTGQKYQITLFIF